VNVERAGNGHGKTVGLFGLTSLGPVRLTTLAGDKNAVYLV